MRDVRGIHKMFSLDTNIPFRVFSLQQSKIGFLNISKNADYYLASATEIQANKVLCYSYPFVSNDFSTSKATNRDDHLE